MKTHPQFNYVTVDISRMCFAFLVVIMHTAIVTDESPQLTFWVSRIFSKIAVPSFCIVFLDKLFPSLNGNVQRVLIVALLSMLVSWLLLSLEKAPPLRWLKYSH